MKPIVSMAIKDLRLLLRDRGGLFFIFFFPLLYAIFFGYITAAMSGGGGDDVVPSVRVALVDEDRTDESAAFTELLISAPELDVLTVDERAVGATLVQEGKRAALLIIPSGFGERGRTFFMGDPPLVQIAADPARTAERGMLEGILQKYGAERMQQAFTDPNAMRAGARQALATLQEDENTPPLVRAALQGFMGSLNRLADELDAAEVTEEDIQESAGAGFQPLIVEAVPLFPRDDDDADEPAMNAFAISFPQGVLWGIMGATAGFGISLVTERTHGTMTRLRMAPLTQSKILAGKALACFLTTIAVATTLLVIGKVAFHVTPASPLLLAIAVMCVAICFVGIMMLLSVLGRTEAAASGIGWAALIVMAMVGGGMIPLMFIQRIAILNALSNLSPVKWSIIAIEGAVWRDFSAQQMLVPCAVLLLIGVGAFAAGAILFRRFERG